MPESLDRPNFPLVHITFFTCKHRHGRRHTRLVCILFSVKHHMEGVLKVWDKAYAFFVL